MCIHKMDVQGMHRAESARNESPVFDETGLHISRTHESITDKIENSDIEMTDDELVRNLVTYDDADTNAS